MAIIFISPKKTQKLFFASLIVVVVLILLAISAVVFVPEFIQKSQNPGQGGLVIAPVVLNLAILDSPEFKSLQPFEGVGTEFVYTVKDKKGKTITGNIGADSVEQAKMLLENSGFSVISLDYMPVGRSQPFVAY